MLNILFEKIGEFGPIILLIYSSYLLWNKANLYFYYNIGIFLNAILNLVLKGIIQQARPCEDIKLFNLALKNGRRFVFKDGVPHDIFGMPSGHAEACLFSTIYVYLSLKNKNILYIYLILSLITMVQRVAYNQHTVLQVVVGAVVGLLFGYFVFYLSQQKLKGIIRTKPDDLAPF